MQTIFEKFKFASTFSRVTINGQRFYQVKDQQIYFPSVTSVLQVINKPSLTQWKIGMILNDLRKRWESRPEGGSAAQERMWFEAALRDARLAPERRMKDASDIGSQSHRLIDLHIIPEVEREEMLKRKAELIETKRLEKEMRLRQRTIEALQREKHLLKDDLLHQIQEELNEIDTNELKIDGIVELKEEIRLAIDSKNQEVIDEMIKNSKINQLETLNSYQKLIDDRNKADDLAVLDKSVDLKEEGEEKVVKVEEFIKEILQDEEMEEQKEEEESIEDDLDLKKNLNIEDMPIKVRSVKDAFDEWQKFSDVEIVLRDTTVYSEKLGYCGSMDALGRKKDGGLVVIDWKTSASIHDEYLLQVSAYARAVEEMCDEPVKEAWVVRFSKDDNRQYEFVKVSNLSETFQAFENALNLWNYYYGLNKPEFRFSILNSTFPPAMLRAGTALASSQNWNNGNTSHFKKVQEDVVSLKAMRNVINSPSNSTDSENPQVMRAEKQKESTGEMNLSEKTRQIIVPNRPVELSVEQESEALNIFKRKEKRSTPKEEDQIVNEPKTQTPRIKVTNKKKND